MESINDDKARFDTKLPKKQKEFFERAAKMGGYRNLTDFVIATVQSKAKEIIEEQERIIASQKDNEIFFDALINYPEPNDALIDARNKYNNFISE